MIFSRAGILIGVDFWHPNALRLGGGCGASTGCGRFYGKETDASLGCPRLCDSARSGCCARIFDTSAGEIIQVQEDKAASLYVCGITPYDATHMGHASTYVAFDLLHRAWLDAGVPVTYVQNVTDVDDPLLERATATNVDWRELAEDQTELFRTDMKALNVIPPAHYVGVVESIGGCPAD